MKLSRETFARCLCFASSNLDAKRQPRRAVRQSLVGYLFTLSWAFALGFVVAHFILRG